MNSKKNMKKRTMLLLLPWLAVNLHAQDELRKQIAEVFDNVSHRVTNIGRIQIDSIKEDKKTLTVYAGANSSYIPYRKDNVEEIYAGVKSLLPEAQRKKHLVLLSEGIPIEDYIPLVYRTGKIKEKTFRTKNITPLTTNLSQPVRPTKGLQNRHIAMWQSHGRYYEPKLDRWEWQRARIFQTVEDLYTQSYVLPFLVPMLENAGAHVMMPRERDPNPIECIVDNDAEKAGFVMISGASKWTKGEGTGFAQLRNVYVDDQNPFTEGTYLQTSTTRKTAGCSAIWIPTLPETREYAVYVSYKSFPNSTSDARYTICHEGGETVVSVNQRMGGGTWIYLGTYRFAQQEGLPDGKAKVVLSNLSSDKAGRIVTADAVKFGGGMGNIGRYLIEGGQTPADAKVSGDPRFCEGARYWMQWAGVPDSIYNLNEGRNDYVDDYKNRGLWVNWLAGGSEVNPKEGGLSIPIDLSLAFHSDAGTTLTDQTVGTLAIYDSKHYDGVFFNGASTEMSHQLADLVQSSIVEDIRTLYEPKWNRRQIWNKPYFEAWMPRVPALLLELLSHQNFADMRYGLDPRFRFTVSRAIYKGILRFISSQRGEPYIVQPLPVRQMALQFISDNEVELSWAATPDTLEPTAMPDRYIVYSRTGEGGWDNGVLVNETRFSANLQPDKVYSYKVVAVNEGGRSFDSEILSAGICKGSKRVLVINGFDRIGAPADFEAPGEAGKKLAGFLDNVDHGVPYLRDISYTGAQKEFRRSIPWMDDDAAGFGDSYGNEERNVIAGNSFDYPAVHGQALLQAGMSFCSCSREAFEKGLPLQDYVMLDLILGKECRTKMGTGKHTPLAFRTFTPAMQEQLRNYLTQVHGSLFASGAYIASDSWDTPLRLDESFLDKEEMKADQTFIQEVLKFKWRVWQAATGGDLYWVLNRLTRQDGHYSYWNTLNDRCYVVESPDAIEPAVPEASTVMRYDENNLSAAVAYAGEDYRTFVMGVPFEALRGGHADLMKQIVDFLLNK